MSADAKFTAENLLSIRPWAPNLFSFRMTRGSSFRFVPGQFARIGVAAADPEKVVWRAYSVASAADAPFLEFFSIVVPGGEFSPALARLPVGGTVYLERTNYGFLTLERFEPARDLWMLCTGTGLAPFLSILREGATWSAYRNVVVVQSVRYGNELAYVDELRSLGHAAAGKATLHHIPVVTRQDHSGALKARIPALLENGALEAHVGLQIEPAASRVLVCGNPEMIGTTRKMLAERGLAPSRRGKPGQLAVENYW